MLNPGSASDRHRNGPPGVGPSQAGGQPWMFPLPGKIGVLQQSGGIAPASTSHEPFFFPAFRTMIKAVVGTASSDRRGVTHPRRWGPVASSYQTFPYLSRKGLSVKQNCFGPTGKNILVDRIGRKLFALCL